MKRSIKQFLTLLVAYALIFGAVLPVNAQQQVQGPGRASNQSRVAGVYVAFNYSLWSVRIFTNNLPAASPQTFQLSSGSVTLPDGRVIVPFFVGEVLSIGAGTTQENVTLTAVSGCYIGAPQGLCTISGNTSNAHGQGELVTSGTVGLGEAINDAGNNGGGQVFWEADTGSVTLATGAATTTLCTNCIPTNAIVLGVVARVTTTIGTCTGGWELGDGTTATRFTAANLTLTAGTVSAADLQTTSGVASTTTGMLNVGGAKSLVNTCVTANASAGAIHAHLWGYVLATPNS